MPVFGAPGAIRTPDPLVRSQVLYPAELRAHAQHYTVIRVHLKALIGDFLHAGLFMTSLEVTFALMIVK